MVQKFQFLAGTIFIINYTLFSFPAHSNIKKFITQCGLHSIEEAVYHGVTILRTPFFLDQKLNKMQKKKKNSH